MARESWCLDTIGQGHPELALFRRRLRAVDGVNSLGWLGLPVMRSVADHTAASAS